MSDTISEHDVPPAKRAKIERENNDDSEKVGEETSKKQDDLENNPKYSNFVTLEELEKLKEFKVLDEVKSNDEDSNDESDSSDGKSEVPEEEIEKMLEEDLPEGFKGAPQPKQKPYITRQIVVLEEKGVNHWEVLPLDWMVVRHFSGMPVYMHRTTRVCTLSKPYFLGKGNTRRHDIPISAIPCLSYRRALEEERKQQEIDRKIAEQIKNGTWANHVNSTNQNLTENLEKNTENDKNDKTENVDESVNDKRDVSNADKKDDTDLTNNITRNDVSSNKTEDLTSSNKPDNLAGSIEVEIATDSETTQTTTTEGHKSLLTKNQIEDDSNNVITEVTNDCEKSEDTLSNDVDLMKAPVGCPFMSRKVTNTELKPSDVCPVTGKSIADTDTEVLLKDKDAQVNTEECNSEVAEGNVTSEAKIDENNKEQCPINEAKGDESNKTSDDIEIPKYRQPVVLPGGIVMPAPKVETINNSWKTQHLSHEQVNDYCKKLFKFKSVNIKHFNRWADRRKYNKARKTLQYPTLPDGTKLITIPASPNGQDNGGKPAKRDWVMNMDGRSYLSVFHEYVRRALQKQPVYEFVQLENAATPYQATVYIGGMQYGVGHGSSKRQAKSAAARASIRILIPEMKDELDAPTNSEPDFSFFDYVGIEDPRISEFCAATCEPSPHAILRTCLLRNFGASDRHIQTEMKKLEFQKIELTMKVGKHTATVVCKNKKTAKQRASQAILQALHPHVRSWGSLLRLYGSRSVKSFKEKKLEEQQITLLQDRARHNQPNRAVLDKLRRDMARLRERDAACVPIGTLLLEDDLPTHSGSNLNNVDL